MKVKATVFFEMRHWVALFERTDKTGYAAAKHVFGNEPTDPEIYNFVINHYDKLHFGKPTTLTLEVKRMNPKRLQKKVRQEMEKFKKSAKPSTLAQDYMREELEQYKKEKQAKNRAKTKEEKEQQFLLKQEKKKQKHKGH